MNQFPPSPPSPKDCPAAPDLVVLPIWWFQLVMGVLPKLVYFMDNPSKMDDDFGVAQEDSGNHHL